MNKFYSKTVGSRLISLGICYQAGETEDTSICVGSGKLENNIRKVWNIGFGWDKEAPFSVLPVIRNYEKDGMNHQSFVMFGMFWNSAQDIEE